MHAMMVKKRGHEVEREQEEYIEGFVERKGKG